MSGTYQCTECGASVTIPWHDKVRYRSSGFQGQITHERIVQRAPIPTVSCRRCGDVCDIADDGSVSRRHASLHMHPVSHDGPLSIWMLTWTRPIKPGNYHVRFRHLEPQVFVAWWDGVNFLDTTGRRVRMGEFLTWRGVLA